MANRKQFRDNAIRNSIIDNSQDCEKRKKQQGYPDLKSEVRNRLGMNQASNIWRTNNIQNRRYLQWIQILIIK